MASFVVEEGKQFLAAFLAGAAIACVYDFLRILRRGIKHADAIVYGEDLLFWILTGMALFYMSLLMNNGEFRLYFFLGMFAGAAVYHRTLSRFIVAGGGFLLKKILEILQYILKKIIKLCKICNIFNIKRKKATRGGSFEDNKRDRTP